MRSEESVGVILGIYFLYVGGGRLQLLMKTRWVVTAHSTFHPSTDPTHLKQITPIESIYTVI